MSRLEDSPTKQFNRMLETWLNKVTGDIYAVGCLRSPESFTWVVRFGMLKIDKRQSTEYTTIVTDYNFYSLPTPHELFHEIVDVIKAKYSALLI